MKKIMTVLLLLAALGLAQQKLKVGRTTVLDSKIGAADSVKSKSWEISPFFTGDFSLTYGAASVAGNVRFDLYYEETNDTTIGWHNRTLIESFTAAKKATISVFRANPVFYIQYVAIGTGIAGDTSTIKMIQNSVTK